MAVSSLWLALASVGLFILLALSARLGDSALWLMIGLLAIILIWLATRRF